MKTPSSIAKRLAHAMEKRKISKARLTASLGIDRANITHWINESEPISPKHFFSICKILDISIYWLVEGIGEMEKPTIIENDYEKKIVKLIRSRSKTYRDAFLIILTNH